MEVFLDTSSLVALCCGNEKSQERVKDCIPNGSQIVVSRYVIYEFAKGFLRNLILLFNKCSDCDGYSDLQSYIARNFMTPHRLGTQLSEMNKWLAQLGDQPENTGNEGTTDKLLLKLARAYLKREIRRYWLKLEKLPKNITNHIGCREDLIPPKLVHQKYNQTLNTKLCGKTDNCGVIEFFQANKSSLESVRQTLASLPKTDSETIKRSAALLHLLEANYGVFKGSLCHSCGDALIAVESPPTAVIVTKNKKHYEPICDALGKAVEYHS